MFGDERSDSRGIRIALVYTHSFGVRLSCMGYLVALPLTLSLLLLSFILSILSYVCIPLYSSLSILLLSILLLLLLLAILFLVRFSNFELVGFGLVGYLIH